MQRRADPTRGDCPEGAAEEGEETDETGGKINLNVWAFQACNYRWFNFFVLIILSFFSILKFCLNLRCVAWHLNNPLQIIRGCHPTVFTVYRIQHWVQYRVQEKDNTVKITVNGEGNTVYNTVDRVQFSTECTPQGIEYIYQYKVHGI